MKRSSNLRRAAWVVLAAALYAWFPTRDLLVVTGIACVAILPLSLIVTAWLLW